MKPARRWPVHPPPMQGEALSSWLHRLAACFQMDMLDLVEHGLGHDHGLDDTAYTTACDRLDFDPPEVLVLTLAERTGIGPDQLRAMTLAGWVPWLFDSLEPSLVAFEVYVHQFSILLPSGNKPTQPNGPWRAWLPDKPVRRACPRCLADPDRAGMLLMWQLPLMLSCPVHHCWVQPCFGLPEQPFWSEEPCTSPEPIASVVQLDSRTHQALTTGQVDLPRRTVHAAIWFRLLRTLINELSTPAMYWGSHADDLRLAWATSGHKVRAGQQRWRPFEVLPWTVQAQLLEAASVTMELLQAGDLTGRGHEAALLTPSPGERSTAAPTAAAFLHRRQRSVTTRRGGRPCALR